MTVAFWINAGLVVLAFSLLLCFVRLYLGPNPPNRTVAFDTIAIHAIVLVAMASKAPSLLDAAIVTAVLGFVGTMMFARYMENSDLKDWEPDEE